MLRRRAAQPVAIELPIDREDTVEIMAGLMRIDGKVEDVLRLLREEDDDGEGTY